jgi:hypothetical protein
MHQCVHQIVSNSVNSLYRVFDEFVREFSRTYNVRWLVLVRQQAVGQHPAGACAQLVYS